METNINTNKLLSERILETFLHFLKKHRLPFFAAFVFGMLAHGFAFTNKLINHDEVYNLFGKGATIDSGRWGLGALDSIFPNYSMPWIYGILTVLLIAVTVCLIVHIFAIHNRLLQVLLAGCIVVFPVWTSTFSFMFTSSSYGVAFLMAALSVYLLRKKTPFFWIIALGCSIFSVSIYQAYIAVIASMLVLILIQDLLQEEDILRTLYRGIFYVGFLILTLGLYYIAAQLVLVIKDVQFNEYAATRNSFDLSTLPSNILTAYQHFFLILTDGEHALVPTLRSQQLHQLSIVISLILLFCLFFAKKMKPIRVVFILALLAVFPLAATCMYLFTLGDAIHTIVLCGFGSVYFLFVMIADLCMAQVTTQRFLDSLRSIALNGIVLVLSVIIVSHTYYANSSYLGLHLQYENTYAFYTSLISDIRMSPEFDENTKLAVIGEWQYPNYFHKKFHNTYKLFGYLAATPSEYSMDRFIEYYIGFPIPFATQAEADIIKQSPEYAQMPVYPYYGSIQMVDDILVVKLS